MFIPHLKHQYALFQTLDLVDEWSMVTPYCVPALKARLPRAIKPRCQCRFSLGIPLGDMEMVMSFQTPLPEKTPHEGPIGSKPFDQFVDA